MNDIFKTKIGSGDLETLVTPSSPSIQTNDTRRKKVDTGLKQLPQSNDSFMIPEQAELIGLKIKSVKVATVAKDLVTKGKLVSKKILGVSYDDSMFGTGPTVKTDYKVEGDAIIAGGYKTDITLVEIITNYGITTSPGIKFTNVINGYISTNGQDTIMNSTINFSTTHSYHMVGGVKRSVINERVITPELLDEITMKLGVVSLSLATISKNADVFSEVDSVQELLSNNVVIKPSSSFEGIQKLANPAFGGLTKTMHLMPIMQKIVRKEEFSIDTLEVTLNDLKVISEFSVQQVTQEQFNSFIKYVKENANDFGKTLKEVLASGDVLDGSKKEHLMAVKINEAVKAAMLSTGVQTMTATFLFRSGTVITNIGHYTNLSIVTERTVKSLNLLINNAITLDLKPFLSMWDAINVYGTFRVDGTDNVVYITDDSGIIPKKEKVSLPSSSESASVNFTTTETISDVAKLLVTDNTHVF